MKVLFLDIDGVVNNNYTTQRFEGFLGIDPKLADHIKRIIKETKCKVVLSSTWRMSDSSKQHVRIHVCNFIDSTPILNEFRAFRGDEIAAWLNEHPEVETYAIIDDDGDFHKDQPLFQTSMSTGITEEIRDRVIKHLNVQN